MMKRPLVYTLDMPGLTCLDQHNLNCAEMLNASQHNTCLVFGLHSPVTKVAITVTNTLTLGRKIA